MDAQEFYANAQEVLQGIGELTFVARECEDRCVGVIRDMTFPFAYSKIDTSAEARVFLILESPHKKELPRSGETAPARDRTGQYIVDFWHEIFGRHFDDLRLCLVNAVRYQCSLGLPISRFGGVKDAIFLRAIQQLQGDLAERLKRYKVRSIDYVIIACSSKAEMCEVVDSVVSNHLQGKTERVFSCMLHPSSWERYLAAAQKRATLALKKFNLIN